MKKLFFLMSVVATSFTLSNASTYIVDVAGSDTNNGLTTATPFKTLHYAITKVVPGDSILMRGGIHLYQSLVSIEKSGTIDNRIVLTNYPGESPNIDYTGWDAKLGSNADARFYARGIILLADYWYIKNLEITNAPDNGLKIEGSNNIIETCHFHHNGDSGLQIGLIKGASNEDGTKVANNFVLNCDSHHNFDYYTKGENADGFACKLYSGKGNRFYGCRSWNNSDDGWDLYMTIHRITIEHCRAWHNGDKEKFVKLSSWSGDGNAFKLGGDGEAGPHLVHHSIAFDSPCVSGCGFEDNQNGAAITIHNCTAWKCLKNYEFNSLAHELKNNITFDGISSNQALASSCVQAKNSWNQGITISASDFESISEEDCLAPRKPDGSYADNGFAKLKAGSPAIDKGMDLGYSYLGSAPDLGAMEFNPITGYYAIDPVAEFTCFPAAVDAEMYVVFNSPIDTNSKLSIIDIQGKTVLTAELQMEIGQNEKLLNLSELSKGVYVCRLESNNRVLTQKVVKK